MIIIVNLSWCNCYQCQCVIVCYVIATIVKVWFLVLSGCGLFSPLSRCECYHCHVSVTTMSVKVWLSPVYEWLLPLSRCDSYHCQGVIVTNLGVVVAMVKVWLLKLEHISQLHGIVQSQCCVKSDLKNSIMLTNNKLQTWQKWYLLHQGKSKAYNIIFLLFQNSLEWHCRFQTLSDSELGCFSQPNSFLPTTLLTRLPNTSWHHLASTLQNELNLSLPLWRCNQTLICAVHYLG